MAKRLDGLGCDLGWGLRGWTRPKPHCVTWGNSSPWKRAQQPPVSQFRDAGFACVRIIRGPCLLWPSGWMDQDATWYGDRTVPRRHCVRWRHSSAPVAWGTPPPLFGQCILWPNGWMDQDTTWYEGEPRPRTTLCQMGSQLPPRKGAQFVYVVSAIFLLPVSAYALAGLLLPPFCNLLRQISHLSLWSRLTLNDARSQYFRFCRNRK